MGPGAIHSLPVVYAFVPFAVSMSFAPGPNNLMLAAAGARFGFVRTLPHIAGALAGFSLMMLLVGFGVARLLVAAPGVYVAMKYASVVLLLYLAWRIATSQNVATEAAKARPMSFLQATAFQGVNPKAWVMALSGVTAYTDPRSSMTMQVLALAAIIAGVGIASATTWTAGGRMIRRYLTTPRRWRVFNGAMAALLALAVLQVLVKH